MGKNDQLEVALRFLELHGWSADHPNKKGYIPLKCSCGGLHMGFLHKTPSNPNHWTQKASYLASLCEQDRKEVP